MIGGTGSFGGGLGISVNSGGTSMTPTPSGVPDPEAAGMQQATQLMSAPFIGAATQFVTGLIGAYEMYQAGEEAKDAASEQAALIREETAQKVKAAEEENARRESAARARAAASGLSGASSELYIQSLIDVGREDIAWLRRVGKSEESIAYKEGQAAYHQARAAMWGQIGSSVAGAALTYSIM